VDLVLKGHDNPMTTAKRIKLIGTINSRATRNVWMLKELGLPYEHDPINFTSPLLKQPPYSDLNPNGRVPICSVDGFVIWESLAINLYLEQAFPSAIGFTSIEERSIAMQWALWVLTEVELHTFNWYVNTVKKPEAERDSAQAAAAWAKLSAPLTALEKALADRDYLFGQRFTVADLNTAAVMHRVLWMPLDQFPVINHWLHRCWRRPAALEVRCERGDKFDAPGDIQV
jgi:glutathione S-transferase